jgi:hypothetical protein
MASTEKRNLERVRYWQGQMLRSRDFNDIHATEQQRRWWHNRALHDAYGIYQDPPLARDPNAESHFLARLTQDETAVTVTAGLAYDSFGRELILESNQTVPLPPLRGDTEEFLLLARYHMEPPNRQMESVAGVCYTNSGPLRPEFVEFVWKHPDQCSFSAADGVPLASLTVGDGTKTVMPVPQPSARPLARPQLGSGSTVPGNTAWELWTSGLEGTDDLPLGVQATIDTSAAGFTDTPCYFAWLQGDLFNPTLPTLAPALFTSIAEESVNSFVFRIAFPPLPAPQDVPAMTYIDANSFAPFARKQNLYVNWIGCQENASAPFFFRLLLLRNPLVFNVLRLSQFSEIKSIAGAMLRLNKL